MDAREAVVRHREHKLQRIEQVRRLLETDPSIEADRLVELVYGQTLEEALRLPATASVRAIAKYLAPRLTGPARADRIRGAM